jgi:hypothetical protein
MSKSQRRKRREGNANKAPMSDAQTAPLRGDDDGDDFYREDREESAEARRKREEWERYHAQAMRERDEGRRELFTAFLLWTICPHKACQRAKACVGDDTEECRRERWREAVPDEVRAEFAKVCELVSEGYDVPEAYRLAREDMIMREKVMAKYEALHPRPQAEEEDALADIMTAARETLDSVESEAPAEKTEPPSPARGPRSRG